jgi:hypothetical protein
MRDGRVLSCSRPSTPSLMNRSCQRHTHGFDTPARRITSAVPQLSAVARMIRARQTCFCGLFRHDRLEPRTVGGVHFDLDPLAQKGNLSLDLIH